MQKIIEVQRSEGSPSKVAIGNVIDELKNYIPHKARVIVITDSTVYGHYSHIIDRYEKIIIAQGEENKTMHALSAIYSELLAAGADRSCFIVGFGGGIVTDVAGFAASTYMRGVRFGFVATTLLAQVDASVGGKNGVNFEGYKNMIGTFNQPEFVLCDTSMLATLPDRELRTGMAEIIKSGLILDEKLFELFENNSFEEFRNDSVLLFESVKRAVRVKKQIVDLDFRETGDRKKLNLGHTFAHAIEKCSRRFTHGEAVAIGLSLIADISVRENLLAPEDAFRIKNVIQSMGLPLTSGIPMKELLAALRNDKKKEAGEISLVLMKGIGECVIRKYSFAEIDRMYQEPI